jgi:hypothetical protein
VSFVSRGRAWLGQKVDILCWRLFSVSAASMSSTDMPDSTLAALVERSWSVLAVSMSIGVGLGRSEEERCEDTGGEKGGGPAYGGWEDCESMRQC